MLHLYALAEHPAQLPAIDGTTLHAVPVTEALDAVVGNVAEATPSPTREAIIGHAQVVEAVAGTSDAVLPARFGRPLRDEAELTSVVREREAELHAALDRVRGCIEVGVRVLCGGGRTGNEGGTGREYLLGRLESVRTAEGVARAIEDAVGEKARERDVRVVAKDDVLVTAAFLVPRSELDSVRASVEELAGGHPALTFVVTGPWPPYSFVTVGGAGA